MCSGQEASFTHRLSWSTTELIFEGILLVVIASMIPLEKRSMNA